LTLERLSGRIAARTGDHEVCKPIPPLWSKPNIPSPKRLPECGLKAPVSGGDGGTIVAPF
jgi:hypothetical protein